jgi:hypothetical protein
MNSIQLTDIMSRMASGQMDVARGSILLFMNFLQLTSAVYLLAHAHWAAVAGAAAHIAVMIAHKAASIALALAEGARAIAHFVANAVATMGVAVPIMLAAAAASAALGGYLIAKHMAEGGLVTTPTFALIGERGPEAVVPLDRLSGRPTNLTINIYEARSARDTAEETMRALRRAGLQM